MTKLRKVVSPERTQIIANINNISDEVIINNNSFRRVNIVNAISGEKETLHINSRVYTEWTDSDSPFKDILIDNKTVILTVEISIKGVTSYEDKNGDIQIHTGNGKWIVGASNVNDKSLHAAKVNHIADVAGLSGLDRAEFLMKHLL